MTVKDIEKAVAQLPKAEPIEFAEWFNEFEAELWDEQIERDMASGRFDTYR